VAPAAGTAAARVVRDGGDFGAGLIRGFSMITVGEAVGHGMWIDDVMVEQTAAAAAAARLGVKVRFTHPGLSGDGLGKFLGRAKNGRVDGQQARADVHFARAAHNTPDGDLATYVMDLAEEDPEAFAASIVFKPDRKAEEQFVADNSDEDGEFTSPDPRNTKHLFHARLAALRAVDAVDQPAANPDGLFHVGQDVPEEADALMSFAHGLCDERPELVSLDVDPDRVRGFVQRWMEYHGLVIRGQDGLGQRPPSGRSAAIHPDPVRSAAIHPDPVPLPAELARLRDEVEAHIV